MTLNQLAASVANTLRHPHNHELKERIKDLFKEQIALFIRRSIKEHGIDNILIVSYTSPIVKIKTPSSPIKEDIETPTFRTEYKVPKPIRYPGDSPFVYVGTTDRLLSFPYRLPHEHNLALSFFSTGSYYSYYLNNGFIHINTKEHNIFKPRYILVEGLFESPEEVLSMYDDIDGQDIQLPFSADLVGLIRDRVTNLAGAIAQEDPRVEINPHQINQQTNE